MIWATAKDLGVSYSDWVHLFQSKFFNEFFPDENKLFKNVTYIDAVDNDRGSSLTKMRVEMLKSYQFDAAVFVGGMEGIFEELALFQKFHPNATLIPVGSTGGAALELAQKLRGSVSSSHQAIDYIGLFHAELKIAPDEPRGAATGA